MAVVVLGMVVYRVVVMFKTIVQTPVTRTLMTANGRMGQYDGMPKSRLICNSHTQGSHLRAVSGGIRLDNLGGTFEATALVCQVFRSSCALRYSPEHVLDESIVVQIRLAMDFLSAKMLTPSSLRA